MIIISDLHGRYVLLQKVLDEYPEETFVFLGDIFDYRLDKAKLQNTEITTALMFLELLKANRAVWIVGNQDYNLFYKSVPPPLTQQTKAVLSKNNIYNMLFSYFKKGYSYYQITDKDNTLIQIAHAHPFSSATKLEQIYGLKQNNNKRLKWWLNYVPIEGTLKICGHYHTIVQGPGFIVMDGECKTLNKLVTYNTNTKEMKYFEYNEDETKSS
jgi:predicted phosphodiesterase